MLDDQLREFGNLAFRCRQANGWSLREAASNIGIAFSRLGEIEQGKDNRSERPVRPRPDIVLRMAEVYCLDPDEALLMTGYTRTGDLTLFPADERELVEGFRELAPAQRLQVLEFLRELPREPLLPPDSLDGL